MKQVEQFKKLEQKKLPEDIDYEDVSRGYTGDTGRLADGHRSVGFQLLA